ncbi:CRE-UNC-73 protein [Caenorhabditis remanei]|uniref:CRE-UNC-73 protein n=1 Tax=Caenorhabditis remanei TaxID=31234 RepID=E3MGG2_CAERE|nr:CRE-UNC-73 protein [Caenorhabditis remanei]
MTMKAEDILHVLRDGIAILHGGRCRAGQAVVVCPPREQVVNQDHLRNVLLYLFEITAKDAREKGFLVVIDMRGKQTWTNVRNILKALTNVDNSSKIQVFIIKPEKFWEKQKAQMSLGTWDFEVEMISFESLIKIIDASQLPKSIAGGSYPYDHDEWLEIRIDLEKWIWNVTEIMETLESVRRDICQGENPIDVETAEIALKKSQLAKKNIFNIPVDSIEAEGNKIVNRILQPSKGVKNPDLQATTPYVSNLTDSLRLLKGDVHKNWDSRQAELVKVYHQKLFERDVEIMIESLAPYKRKCERSMGDVGGCVSDVNSLAEDFEKFQLAVKGMEVSVKRVFDQGNHLRTSGARNQITDHVTEQLTIEWRVVKELMDRRSTILHNAREFFKSAQCYFAEIPSWTAQPGVNPNDVMFSQESLEIAIRTHDSFWAQVEEIYAQAYDDALNLMKSLKESDTEDNVAKEHSGRLQRAHKQLGEKWKERQVLLHHMLAMIAFETDVKLVVDWLQLHGEPYLRRNIHIGENMNQARTFQRNHTNFQRVAANTYGNVQKLRRVYQDVTNSGSQVCDVNKMQELMTDLTAKIEKFTTIEQSREHLLRQSVLFHTHYTELTDWYAKMREKYNDKRIDLTVQVCDKNKERFVLETDETAQAYAMTIDEGKTLVEMMHKATRSFDVDYAASIAHIQILISDIEEKNTLISSEWGPRRTLLHIASKFAMFEQNKFEVLEQIQGWEEDMREMIESPSFHEKADNVMPYHIENQEKVREAISSIQKAAMELSQVLYSHKLTDLRDKRDRIVLEAIRGHVRELELSETRVMSYANETSSRINAVREVVDLRKVSDGVCRLIDTQLKALTTLGVIPHDYSDTVQKQDELRAFRDAVTNRLRDPYDNFVVRFRELMENPLANRDVVVQYNEVIQTKYRRLMALCEERNKLLKSAHGCYKTYETAVLPILNQLESEYHSPTVTDWCAGCTSTVHADRAAYIDDLLNKHDDYKERFGKGCTYALRNGDFLLRYIKRANVAPNERKRHENKIADMKNNIRERQSNILELWLQKKALLQGCKLFICIEARAAQLLEFMNGEGNDKLKQFEKRGRGELNDDDDEFAKFKSEVKQKKTDIQTFLMLCTDDSMSRGVHTGQIDRCIEQVKEKFNQFSRRVGDCEVVLRGENGGPSTSKDEFSLDRHSDTAIFNERTINQQRAENRKTLEPMRELIQSERDYIKDLERCVNIYVKEFDQAVKNGTVPTLPKYEIFGNIEKIFQFHHDKLLPELVKYENQPEAVGASFTVWIDLLNELYTEYCVNKEQKNYMLATPEAVAFFTGIREKHGLEINNEIASLLIKPVQRITRYRLLIEQLLKSCNDKAYDLKEAYEVVCSVPRKVNDLIHFNCLELKNCNVDELGPFVTQDTLTVWEPRAYFKGRGKERQVFLFDLSIVFAKRLEISPKNFKYVIKGKPLPLSEVSIVEHVEGDSCRFGLRVGTVSSNDNRTDLKASNENTKVKWVLKIRELTTGMLPLGLGVSPALSVGTLSSARSVSHRSGASTSSGGENRQSQDVESLLAHRYSVHSVDSEQSSEVWIVTSDFDGNAEGHLTVRKGDRVEIVEDQATDCAEYIQVVLCDQPSKHGLVPVSIIVPPESGSVPDRPDDTNASGSAVSKRKSLRRIFANSSKERASSSNNNSPATRQSTSTSSPVTANGHTAEPIGVLSSGESSTAGNSNSTPSASTPTHRATPSSSPTVVPVVVSEEEKVEDCLPPPMENITINNSMEEKDMNEESVAASDVAEPEVPEKAEKTPEETARFKRSYVLMELVETEQDYVKDLTSVVEGYIGNLEKMDLPADLVGKDKIIFANISQILDFHKTCFLKEIEKCQNNYEAAGAAFVKYDRRLRNLYVTYCQNKPKSDYLLAQDDFEGFFADTKAKLGHKVALCDLLIKPVQRIMKYQLLLKDILKFTERAKDRPDVLKKALQVMHVVPKACDDMMQVGRLQNFDGNLNAQGNLIHQGTLQICESVAGNTQKPKDRRIFLFEQSAIFADHIPPKKDFGNPTYIFKNQIMVNKMVFEPHVADDPLRFVIKSSDPTQPTSFIANAQTQEEKDEWNKKISEQLDQQKRLLAALVDPKRFMGGNDDMSGGMGNMSLGGNDKKASTSGSDKKASTSTAKPSSSTSKKSTESPKKESKSKSLFSFGKKPAKSPTSPPPLEAAASGKFNKVTDDQVNLDTDEKVQVLEVKNGYASVKKADGTIGKCPNYFLTMSEIPGNNFAEQIQYRREWQRRVDETEVEYGPSAFDVTTSSAENFDVLLELSTCERPVVVEEMKDLEVVEGDDVEMSPVISSHTDFNVVWHGPAVDSKRARIQTNQLNSRLLIKKVQKCDSGAYSVIAKNSFGVTSTVAFLSVIAVPEPPTEFTVKVTGDHEVRLKWKAVTGLKYCIEYRALDGLSSENWQIASTNIEKTHVSLRNFARNSYSFRVFAYNQRVRSAPSNCICVHFDGNLKENS